MWRQVWKPKKRWRLHQNYSYGRNPPRITHRACTPGRPAPGAGGGVRRSGAARRRRLSSRAGAPEAGGRAAASNRRLRRGAACWRAPRGACTTCTAASAPGCSGSKEGRCSEGVGDEEGGSGRLKTLGMFVRFCLILYILNSQFGRKDS